MPQMSNIIWLSERTVNVSRREQDWEREREREREEETSGQCYKTFYKFILQMGKEARVFVPGESLQPSVMFVSKFGSSLLTYLPTFDYAGKTRQKNTLIYLTLS
jgi:hypothetical protein